MTETAGGPERRRHRREARDVGDVSLRHAGHAVVVVAADVRDVGIGGCFLLVSPPPALTDDVVVTLLGFELRGRVVRVQRAGRDRGAPVRPGIAVAFVGVDEPTLEALALLLE
ncbi:MAG: PilZ domain-containing protein [Deltaproteobacteria bacterium]|nr:PilZ domain-containing protein [Deltaproteobacteria bacterium]